jgi:dynein heavy chain
LLTVSNQLTNEGHIRYSLCRLKHAIVSHCHAWQEKLTTLLNSNAATQLTELQEKMTTFSGQLETNPTTLDELSNLVTSVNKVHADLSSIDSQFPPLHEQYAILEKYEVNIKETERNSLRELDHLFARLSFLLSEADNRLPDLKAKFKAELLSAIDEYAKSVGALCEDFETKGPFEPNIPLTDAMKSIDEYKGLVSKLASRERELRKGLALFRVDQAPSKDLEILARDLENLQQSWMLAKDWTNSWSVWGPSLYRDLSIESLQDAATKYSKRLSKITTEAKNWEVLLFLSDRVGQFSKLIPVIARLQNQALRDRHWLEISQVVGQTITVRDALSVSKLAEFAMEQYTPKITAISSIATEELTIETTLSQISGRWNNLKLNVVALTSEEKYQKIDELETIQEEIEDSQVSLSAIKTSSHYKAFEKDVNDWEKLLNKLNDHIDCLIRVQTSWIYLETCFAGVEDIRRQLPREYSLFDEATNSWRELLRLLAKTNDLMQTLTEKQSILQEIDVKLEVVHKSLDGFLETKRQAFPRLYFLSNDELLHLLGQARDPFAIQPYLKKCFDSVHRLQFSSSIQGGEVKIIGMYSEDGEHLALEEPLVVVGSLEIWLSDVEVAMRSTLKSLLNAFIIHSKRPRADRSMNDWPFQILMLGNEVLFTSECEKALEEVAKGSRDSLYQLRKKIMNNLSKSIVASRGEVDENMRRKISTFATIEVHHRDVVERLMKAGINSVKAYAWTTQIRYRFDSETNECRIYQARNISRYGFEYIGVTGRLVITPVIEKCYQSLLTALSFYQGASLYGPAVCFALLIIKI